MKLKASKADMVAHLRNIANSFKGHAEKQRINFRCTYDPPILPAYFDGEKIKAGKQVKIVQNCLSETTLDSIFNSFNETFSSK